MCGRCCSTTPLVCMVKFIVDVWVLKTRKKPLCWLNRGCDLAHQQFSLALPCQKKIVSPSIVVQVQFTGIRLSTLKERELYVVLYLVTPPKTCWTQEPFTVQLFKVAISMKVRFSFVVYRVSDFTWK